MTLRDYTPADCGEMARLFYDTVHGVNCRDYSSDQLFVWATGQVDLDAWNASFLAHDTVIAVDRDKLVGFADRDGDYLDRLYVHRDQQGRGIATALLERLETQARQEGVTQLTTHASITARPFFLCRGFTLVREQQVERGGILLTNFIMKKRLLL